MTHLLSMILNFWRDPNDPSVSKEGGPFSDEHPIGGKK
jgi:hypothetical protein